MTKRRSYTELAIAGVFGLLVGVTCCVSGCTSQPDKTHRFCPGKENLGEAVTVLEQRWRNVSSFRGNGQCRLEYYDPDGKRHRERCSVKVFVEPPSRLYAQVALFLDAKGIVLGTNEQDFWFVIRPKEARGYWWGKWPADGRHLAEPDCFSRFPLLISPHYLLEGFGLARLDAGVVDTDWHLTNLGRFDILTYAPGEGSALKKVYVDSCDYLVRKIEYLDDVERPLLVTVMDRYKEISGRFKIATLVKMVWRASNGQFNSLTINLKTVRAATFSERQAAFLFSRPPSGGFEQPVELDIRCK